MIFSQSEAFNAETANKRQIRRLRKFCRIFVAFYLESQNIQLNKTLPIHRCNISQNIFQQKLPVIKILAYSILIFYYFKQFLVAQLHPCWFRSLLLTKEIKKKKYILRKFTKQNTSFTKKYSLLQKLNKLYCFLCYQTFTYYESAVFENYIYNPF